VGPDGLMYPLDPAAMAGTGRASLVRQLAQLNPDAGLTIDNLQQQLTTHQQLMAQHQQQLMMMRQTAALSASGLGNVALGMAGTTAAAAGSVGQQQQQQLWQPSAQQLVQILQALPPEAARQIAEVARKLPPHLSPQLRTALLGRAVASVAKKTGNPLPMLDGSDFRSSLTSAAHGGAAVGWGGTNAAGMDSVNAQSSLRCQG